MFYFFQSSGPELVYQYERLVDISLEEKTPAHPRTHKASTSLLYHILFSSTCIHPIVVLLICSFKHLESSAQEKTKQTRKNTSSTLNLVMEPLIDFTSGTMGRENRTQIYNWQTKLNHLTQMIHATIIIECRWNCVRLCRPAT